MVDARVESTVNLIALQKAIMEGFSEGLEQTGKHIVDLASQLAPEDTGKLKESGESHVIDNVLEVSFGNGLPDDRAVAQEFGTIFMPAQPYLSVAIKEIDVVEEIAKSVRKRLV